MRNIALLIEYDGTDYGGWQVQKNSRSIQGVVEEQLTRLLQEKVGLVGAGRTDAGVHARGQVANFHTERDWAPRRLIYALNGTLPRDIAIRESAEVPADFHSRFDARARRYSYRIVSRKIAIGKEFAASLPYELAVDSMNAAAGYLIGKKNFRSFTKYADQQRHFLCDIYSVGWKTEGEAFMFTIEGNRFLHGMVRAIVGTLVDVGRGRLSVEEFAKVVDAADRSAASMSAPACGLCLDEVRYEFDIWKKDAGESKGSISKLPE